MMRKVQNAGYMRVELHPETIYANASCHLHHRDVVLFR